MDNFRTRVKIPEFPFSIDHKNALMCIGSCFAEHMFSKLAAFKFNAFLNPFGILYNPIVIGDSLSAMMDKALQYRLTLFLTMDYGTALITTVDSLTRTRSREKKTWHRLF
jgi:hypothetical protein